MGTAIALLVPTAREPSCLNPSGGTHMVLKELFVRRWLRCLGLAGVAAAGYVVGLTTDHVAAQQPNQAAAQAPAQDKRIVAYVYGNIPVTREELGDFLIMRGGHEKLDLLVNKRII